MKTTVNIIVFSLLCWCAGAQNYLTMGGRTSSGYVVAHSGWSTDYELGYTRISISDLKKLTENIGKNPILANTNTYTSGYLVGMSGWSNDEIRKVDISIAELRDMMKTVKELKTENEALKRKLASLEENQALIAYFTGFTLPENDVQVAGVQAAGIAVFVEGKTIILENIQGLPVTVYQLNGTILTNKTANDNTLSIETPSAGVYIVLAGEEAVKVIVS